MTPPRIPSPAAPAPVVYDRRAWERQLLAASGVNHDMRIVGLVLAHLADDAGELPAAGPHSNGQLARLCRLQEQRIREAVNSLQDKRFLTRPVLQEWTKDVRQNYQVRPVTLTMPLARRSEPAHTSAVPA
ncbi:hypothetical protein AB0F46_01815 [Streptomyces sp. NPDC026665]|uniref:hypothetical protein n=1 Tax=Streptomyces sp. NPDC026665 TaxID=3154798 RepID=UPI0033E8D62A